MAFTIDVNITLPKGYNGITLPAQQALSLVPSDLLVVSKQKQNMRPPLGVYNISLSQAVERCQRVLLALVNLPSVDSSKHKDSIRKLLDCQDAFLDSLFEHIEDCRNILRCMTFKDQNRILNILKKWDKAVKPYRDHIGHVVNHIKHSQGRLRSVQMSNKHKLIYGYFVEGLTNDGSIGPHPDIHDGGHTAFSFNRDLRFHVSGLFHLSAILSECIIEYKGYEYRFSVEPKEEHDDLACILESIARLPIYVFPDEAVLKDWIYVSFLPRRGSATRHFRIKFPCKHQHPCTMKNGHFNATMMGDGVSRQFRIPYMGKESYEDLVRKRR